MSRGSSVAVTCVPWLALCPHPGACPGDGWFLTSVLPNAMFQAVGLNCVWLRKFVVSAWNSSPTLPGKCLGIVLQDAERAGRDPAGRGVYLGRPWRRYSRVLFLDCAMGEHIHPAGGNWRNPENEKTVWCGEFATTGPGGRMDERATWARRLSPDDAARFRLELFLAGDGLWNPAGERAKRGAPPGSR
jgi:pectin methylesterase-like acyl-CoA thioesterase